MPPEFTYDGKWSVRKVQQGKDVSHIEYFEQHGLYALATHTPEEFLLVDSLTERAKLSALLIEKLLNH